MKFTGVIPAIITPMHNDEGINKRELQRQVNRQITAGAETIFCLGTNGEFYALSYEEKISVIETVVEACQGKAKVLAGTGCVTTKETIQLSNDAKQIGVDGLSVICPYFAQASQQDLLHHFMEIADHCDLPLLIYNNPARTGANVAEDTLTSLANHENIVGIKDSSGNFDNILRYISSTNRNFTVLSGNDSLILWTLLAGGAGGISGICNLFPERMISIYTLFKNGDVEQATRIQKSVRGIRNTLKLHNPNSIVKRAMELCGYKVGPARAPFQIKDTTIDQKIIEALSQYSEYKRSNS